MSKYNPYIETIALIMTVEKISIRELAAKSKLPPSKIAYMFQHNCEPRITTLIKICNALELRVSDFFEIHEKLTKKETNS
jgi:DNA-binding Xre family transcriptional regulator